MAQNGISFAADIKILFTQGDIACMAGRGVDLDGYQYMSDPSSDADYPDHAHARHVYARLSGTEKPRMPQGGQFWTIDMLNKFQLWMNGGFLP